MRGGERGLSSIEFLGDYFRFVINKAIWLYIFVAVNEKLRGAVDFLILTLYSPPSPTAKTDQLSLQAGGRLESLGPQDLLEFQCNLDE